MEENSLLTKKGMELVMFGGNARELIRKAMKEAACKHITIAKELLVKANEELIKGHRSQTEVLQLECSGESQGYNVLFCHGMDTLMTVKSEYEIAEILLNLLENLYEQK